MNLRKKNIRFFKVIIFFFYFAHNTTAQGLDSLFTSFSQKPRVLVGFNSHYSFINNTNANILGIKAGTKFGERLDLTIGWHKLNSAIFQNYTENDGTLHSGYLHFSYFTYSTNYVYFQTRHWAFNMNIQLGVGKTFYKYTYNNNAVKKDGKIVFIYEPVVGVKYMILKWLGVKTDVGYRITFMNKQTPNELFNSPTYSFGGVLYIGEFYKSVVKPMIKPRQAQPNKSIN